LPATVNETVSEIDRLHHPRLNHLQALEAESLYILREAVAEFARPVMLYSIGKDSSVMLRLAQKAFYPGRIPFPLLHVDTSYKFREMITFRDSYAQEIGAELIVHRNEEAIAAGASPWTLGTQNCCGALKTRSLLMRTDSGTRRISAPSCGAFITLASAKVSRYASFLCRIGQSSTSGSTSTQSRFQSSRSTSPKSVSSLVVVEP
jgi:Phosphoadenosine phosphosulfate reductase family